MPRLEVGPISCSIWFVETGSLRELITLDELARWPPGILSILCSTRMSSTHLCVWSFTWDLPSNPYTCRENIYSTGLSILLTPSTIVECPFYAGGKLTCVLLDPLHQGMCCLLMLLLMQSWLLPRTNVLEMSRSHTPASLEMSCLVRTINWDKHSHHWDDCRWVFWLHLHLNLYVFLTLF